MVEVGRGRQSVGERSAMVGERSAIGRRKVGKVRQIFSDHIAIESTIIAEYSLIQFVPDPVHKLKPSRVEPRDYY